MIDKSHVMELEEILFELHSSAIVPEDGFNIDSNNIIDLRSNLSLNFYLYKLAC